MTTEDNLTSESTETQADAHERVILVDTANEPTGPAAKFTAHEKGLLHRAVSVFVFDSSERLLLQRRAASKYHSPGLWSNTCCGHPRPGEEAANAAARRLREEMGFSCPLREVFSFLYSAAVGSRLTEHEYDHVYAGFADVTPCPSPTEVQEHRWAAVSGIQEELRTTPERFTAWFPQAFHGLVSRGVPS